VLSSIYIIKNSLKGGELTMRRILTLLILGIVMTLSISNAYAVTTSGAIQVTATIQAGTPDMTVKVYLAPNGDSSLINFNAPVASMAFSKFDLVQRPNKAAQWTSVDQFVAFVYAAGLGKQYKITSSGSGSFTRQGGSETLPPSSFACTPVYSATDKWTLPNGDQYEQGAKPALASLGSIGQALAANKLVYQSENPGSSRILQIWYSFPPYTVGGGNPYDPYSPIPSSQASGTYLGASVTIDILPVGP